MAARDSEQAELESASGDTAAAPTVGELFRGFLVLGLTGFGGVLPLARHMIVEQRRWLTPSEFTELLSLCQVLPGGNIINVAAAIGMKFRGVAGALATLIGLIAAPTAIVIALGVVYARLQSDPHVVHMFAGLAAAAAGLLCAMAIKIALPLRRNPIAIAFAVVCLTAVAGFNLPLVPTILVLAPLSIVVARRAGL
jgi:chromate transporter